MRGMGARVAAVVVTVVVAVAAAVVVVAVVAVAFFTPCSPPSSLPTAPRHTLVLPTTDRFTGDLQARGGEEGDGKGTGAGAGAGTGVGARTETVAGTGAGTGGYTSAEGVRRVCVAAVRRPGACR